MPDTISFDLPNPAILRFRGLDLEAITALQMRNIDAIRRMANMMLDSTQTITERQAAFLMASADQMNAALDRGDGTSDPQDIFERQAETYRDLFEALAAHAGELAKITSNCCAGLIQEATRNTAENSVEEDATEPPIKRAGRVSRSRATKNA